MDGDAEVYNETVKTTSTMAFSEACFYANVDITRSCCIAGPIMLQAPRTGSYGLS